MKAVILHTDFRIYWPARIKALNALLKEKGISLDVIEIAGAGSPYSFASKTQAEDELKWHILFDEKMEQLGGNVIWKKLKKLLDEINPDVIIAGAIAFPSGALAVRWSKKNKKKVIIFDDAKVADVKRSGLVNYIKQAIYNGADAMFYPAEEWKETGKYWGFSEERQFYGVDVVDNKFWQQTIKETRSIEEKYLLSIGRQIPKKNFLYLLREYKKYYEEEGDEAYKLVLVGDGEEHKKIAEYIDKNGLNNQVILKPFIQQKELVEIYRNAAAFVLASKQDETWGLVINEAMASGLPIFASDRCGATETLVKEGKNGYVFSPFDEENLYNKLVQFHKLEEAEQKEMGEASLEIIKHWDVDKFAESAYKAIKYVAENESRKISLIDKIIINIWKGRYRPI